MDESFQEQAQSKSNQFRKKPESLKYCEFNAFKKFFYDIQFYTQEKKEITVRSQSKDKCFIRISQHGVYEFKELTKSYARKHFLMSLNLSARIVKTEMLENKYRFIVKIGDQTSSVFALIEGKQQLQVFLKVLGFYIPLNGFQQMVTMFKKTGEGAFAQVYEVITNYQYRYAVKCFEKKQLQKCQKSKKAFYNEIDLMKKLSSPHIIPFQYMFETDKAYYLKMQFFQKTLKQKIGTKLLVKEQKTIMRQLLLGLLEMKNKNIIHRDLKPQNIMFKINQKGEEECVIIDFGLSTLADSHTYIYLRCGTPGFLAPEIANLGDKNQKQTCAADMFSLGCIFYKILTGHYLFSGKTAKEMLQANRKCQFQFNSFSKLSIDQKRLLLRMIDADPSTRIKPEEALKDPYFQQHIDDQDEIPEQECKINEKVKKISLNSTVKSMDSIKSWTSMKSIGSQAFREMRRSQLKDSCLTLQFRSIKMKEGQNSSRKSQLSKSVKRSEMSLRKSRFSNLQCSPVL